MKLRNSQKYVILLILLFTVVIALYLVDLNRNIFFTYFLFVSFGGIILFIVWIEIIEFLESRKTNK